MVGRCQSSPTAGAPVDTCQQGADAFRRSGLHATLERSLGVLVLRYDLKMVFENRFQHRIAQETPGWLSIPEYGRLRADRCDIASECLLRYIENLNAHAREFQAHTAADLKDIAARLAAALARSHEYRLAGVRRSWDMMRGASEGSKPGLKLDVELTSQGNMRVSIASADPKTCLPLTWPEEYGRQQRPAGELVWLKGVGWLFEEERWGWERHEEGRQAFVDLGVMLMTTWYYCVADVCTFSDVDVRSQVTMDRGTCALEQVATPLGVDGVVNLELDVVQRMTTPKPSLYRLRKRIEEHNRRRAGL